MDVRKKCLVFSPRPEGKATERRILNHLYASGGKHIPADIHPPKHTYSRTWYGEIEQQLAGPASVAEEKKSAEEEGRCGHRGSLGSISIHKRQMNPWLPPNTNYF